MLKKQDFRSLDLSVIIPFKDKAVMTIDCIKSLLLYGPVVTDIILVSNNSSTDEFDIVKAYCKDFPFIKLYTYNHPFNYQKINNWAVKKSHSQVILFLNNDTELKENSCGLIEKMYQKALNRDVGAIGCLLLFGDEKTIQHAGVYLMPEGQADHLYITKHYQKALERNNHEEFPYDLNTDRPLTAVTGAVQLIERVKFDTVNGFDEKFIICGGDVDLCLRLNEAGYQTWYVAGGYILHKESQSRKFIPIPYNDFFCSYQSYVRGFDTKVGDPFLPEITKSIRINGV